MAQTGSIQTASVTLVKHEELESVDLTLTNASGARLNAGDQVNIKASTNLSVELADAGTDFPIGIVKTPGDNGEKVVIKTVFMATLRALATGGTLNAGSFAKPNGLKTSGVPQYVAVADKDYFSVIVLSGNTVGNEITLGVLRSPLRSTN